jgi:hypothetical protein
MKKFLLTAAFAMFGFSTMQSQSFGIKGGVNFANLSGDGANDFNVLTNFHVGALYEVQLLDFLSLQPELIYSVQGAKVQQDEIKLNYFTVPLMLKIYLNGNFNIQAGPQFSMLINESDNFAPFKSETFDFGFTGGLEFFVTEGLFVQARYYAGTKEVTELANLKNRVVSVSLGYIF